MRTQGDNLRRSVVIAAIALATSHAPTATFAAEPAETSGVIGTDASDPVSEEARGDLPEGGSGDRPAMPRLDLDLLYPSEGVIGQAGGGVSFSQVGEDLYLTVNLSMVIAGDGWAIAPRLPLRLRVVDLAPTSSADVVRTADWDEPGDFARLLAFAQYGRPSDHFFARFGEFAGASVGHGTLVNRYYNTVDIDHYQGGIIGAVDFGIAGGEVLLDNVLGPEVIVGRPYARPFHWFDALPAMFRNLKVGVTLGGDFNAPLELVAPEIGAGVHAPFGGAGGIEKGAAAGVASTRGQVAVDRQNRPRVARSQAVSFLGIDLEIPFLSLPNVDVVPFFDLNSIDTLGVGFHFGSFVTVRLGSLTEWRTRLEYRLSGAGYEPGYVGPFYEIHRQVYRDGLTKLAWLRKHPNQSRTGFLVESEFRIIGTMRYMLAFSHDEGAEGQPASNDLVMRLRFPELGPVSVSAFYARLDFQSFEELADPRGTVFAINARYNIMDFLYVRARVLNEWWLREEANGQGSYETTTDFDFGVGVIFDL